MTQEKNLLLKALNKSLSLETLMRILSLINLEELQDIQELQDPYQLLHRKKTLFF